MQEYMQFIGQHWVLSALFIVILALLILFEIRNQVGGKKVQPQQLVDMINHNDAAVIDIRSRDNFKEGHIINAVNIEAKDLQENSAKLNPYKNKPAVLVCSNGIESAKHANQLQKQGFEQLFTLHGGLTAWRNASLPIAKGK